MRSVLGRGTSGARPHSVWRERRRRRARSVHPNAKEPLQLSIETDHPIGTPRQRGAAGRIAPDCPSLPASSPSEASGAGSAEGPRDIEVVGIGGDPPRERTARRGPVAADVGLDECESRPSAEGFTDLAGSSRARRVGEEQRGGARRKSEGCARSVSGGGEHASPGRARSRDGGRRPAQCSASRRSRARSRGDRALDGRADRIRLRRRGVAPSVDAGPAVAEGHLGTGVIADVGALPSDGSVCGAPRTTRVPRHPAHRAARGRRAFAIGGVAFEHTP